MIVTRIYMWPKGAREQARLLSTAALSCIGQATRDEGNVRQGERAYNVRLFKDVEFGGPTDSTDLQTAKVWRSDQIRGHMPGPRGVWDLLGGAMKVVLGNRLNPYVATAPAPAVEVDEDAEKAAVVEWLRRKGEKTGNDWFSQAAAYVEAT